MYIYEGHMGSLFATDELLSYEECYCETCGDSDWFIGEADTRKEAWELLKDEIDINGSGGWNFEYVANFINSNWEE